MEFKQGQKFVNAKYDRLTYEVDGTSSGTNRVIVFLDGFIDSVMYKTNGDIVELINNGTWKIC